MSTLKMVFEHFLNDDISSAQELFHQYCVEQGRKINEDLMTPKSQSLEGDLELDLANDLKKIEGEVAPDTHETVVSDIEAAEDELADDLLGAEETEEVSMDETEEELEDDSEDEESEEEADLSEIEDTVEELEDTVEDLEDRLFDAESDMDEIRAEFNKLMAVEKEEHGDELEVELTHTDEVIGNEEVNDEVEEISNDESEDKEVIKESAKERLKTAKKLYSKK